MPPEPTKTNYNKLKHHDLEQLCMNRALPSHGTKVELAARLLRQDNEMDAEEKKHQLTIRELHGIAAGTGAGTQANESSAQLATGSQRNGARNVSGEPDDPFASRRKNFNRLLKGTRERIAGEQYVPVTGAATMGYMSQGWDDIARYIDQVINNDPSANLNPNANARVTYTTAPNVASNVREGTIPWPIIVTLSRAPTPAPAAASGRGGRGNKRSWDMMANANKELQLRTRTAATRHLSAQEVSISGESTKEKRSWIVALVFLVVVLLGHLCFWLWTSRGD